MGAHISKKWYNRRMKTGWEEVKSYLPAGWEAKAREEGAFQRSRGIKSAEELLMLNLVYVADGGSYQAASEMMRLASDIHVNKNAARNRIKGSWKWLRWMAQELCREQGYYAEKPDWLGERRVILVDASDMSLRGSRSSDYRLHSAFDLYGFSWRTAEITTNKAGEKLERHEVEKGDVFIADRAYCTRSGMEHMYKNGGDYILRYRAKGFKLYDRDGETLELLPYLRGLQAWESAHVDCYYRLNSGELRPMRLVAMKKDAAAEEASRRKKQYKVRNRQKAPIPQETMELNSYILLATNLYWSDAQILELYRARWQIELVFRRLKGLYGFGEVPSKNPDSVKAWFYGKLLLAALCEAVIKKEDLRLSQTLCKSPSWCRIEAPRWRLTA